jgi:hypothetical protein
MPHLLHFFSSLRNIVQRCWGEIWKALKLLRGRHDVQLRWGSWRSGTYIPQKREAGFFSLCTTSLADLGDLNLGVKKVSSRGAFKEFRTIPGVNSWSQFFLQPAIDSLATSALRFDPHADHHGIYQDLDFPRYAPFVRNYFSPSKKVQRRHRALVAKYNLDLGKTIAVNIRGTDKHTEISQAPVERYLSLAREMRERYPFHKVLLVTDQGQFIAPFREEFGKDLVLFSELPTTQSGASIHSLLSWHQRHLFGKTFLATIRIISQADVVITHTGNGAFWTALYRGNANRFIQVRGSDEIYRSADVS